MRLALTLARHAGDSEREEMLDRIEQDTIQLDSTLEQILTVSRLESGQIKPKFEPLSLNDLVDGVLDDAKFEAAATNTTITCAAIEDVQVNGDPGMLRSAIENVVRNAIFYSGEGGRIEVELAANDTSAALTVRDNGPGVPEEKLKLIFEPFYRVDDSRGTTTGGMGLGLALADNAMRAHDGGIMAGNIQPHGLAVTLMMPRLPSPPASGSSDTRRALQTASKPE